MRFAGNDSDSCPWAGWTGKAVVHDRNLGTPGMKAWERNYNKWVRFPPMDAAKVGHMLTLDDLKVEATAEMPMEVFELLKKMKLKEPLVYCGVNGGNQHVYMLPNGDFLYLERRIEK